MAQVGKGPDERVAGCCGAEVTGMRASIERLVDQFEARRLTRQQLVASLTALVAGAAHPAAQSPASVAQGANTPLQSTSAAAMSFLLR